MNPFCTTVFPWHFKVRAHQEVQDHGIAIIGLRESRWSLAMSLAALRNLGITHTVSIPGSSKGCWMDEKGSPFNHPSDLNSTPWKMLVVYLVFDGFCNCISPSSKHLVSMTSPPGHVCRKKKVISSVCWLTNVTLGNAFWGCLDSSFPPGKASCWKLPFRKK